MELSKGTQCKTTSELSHQHNPSTRPWYYTHGKAYLAEKRLSAKYESESRRRRQNEQAHKYFEKCNSDMKLYSNWNQQKPLIKYRQPENDQFAPYFAEDVLQESIDKNFYNDNLKTASRLVASYRETETSYKKNFMDCSLIVKYMFELLKVYKDVKEKREGNLTNIHKYLQDPNYSSVKDPLRQVCFLTKELLYFYKSQIFALIKLLRPINCINFLSESEQSELHELNNRCFQIIDMYIQLNEMRNNHFQRMFNEERETIWSQQKKIWNKEINIWDSLFIKLLKSNYLLVNDKLKATIQSQNERLKERFAQFETLKSFVDEIKCDSKLQTILYTELDQITE